MCSKLNYLAKHSNRDFVALCEHGTMHVAWGRACVAVLPEEFEALLRRVDALRREGAEGGGEAEARPAESARMPSAVRPGATLPYSLPIAEISLHFDRPALRAFSALLSEAEAEREARKRRAAGVIPWPKSVIGGA